VLYILIFLVLKDMKRILENKKIAGTWKKLHAPAVYFAYHIYAISHISIINLFT